MYITVNISFLQMTARKRERTKLPVFLVVLFVHELFNRPIHPGDEILGPPDHGYVELGGVQRSPGGQSGCNLGQQGGEQDTDQERDKEPWKTETLSPSSMLRSMQRISYLKDLILGSGSSPFRGAGGKS